MSVLDFSVSRDGYLIDTQLSEYTPERINEAIVEMGSGFGMEVKWREKTSAIFERITRLRYNTDMRPSSIDEFEQLNSEILNLADIIAKQTCKNAVSYPIFIRSLRKQSTAIIEPHMLRLELNMRKIRTKMDESHIYRMGVSPRFFTHYSMIHYMTGMIDNEFANGLSDQIVDLPYIVANAGPEITENLPDVESFDDLLRSLLSSDSELFDVSPCKGEDIKRVVMEIREQMDFDYASMRLAKKLSSTTEICFAPFKMISRAAMKNLDEVYEAGRIPDSVYIHLVDMANTVINMFTSCWINSYMNLAEIKDAVEYNIYLHKVIDVLKETLYGSKEPIDQTPAEAEPEGEPLNSAE